MSALEVTLQSIAATNLSDVVNSVRVARVAIQGPPGIASGAVDYILWDTTPETTSTAQGSMAWDADEKTLSLIQNGTTLQLGQEQQWNVRNNSGATIVNGAAVMATGAIGASGRITAGLMDGTNSANAMFLLGMATEDIANNTDGKVSTFGKVRDIDTSGPGAEVWADEDVLWISPDTAGLLTNVEPTVDQLAMPVGFVIFANPTNGTIAVRLTPIDENDWVKRIGGSYKGAYEPIKANGLVTGVYAFDYAAGNIHSVTFDATDCTLSWDNLPATGNRGSVGLNTTTGGTLPSTLGGSASPDWQVELLTLLTTSSSQTFELWVDDGATVRIQEYKYSGQA